MRHRVLQVFGDTGADTLRRYHAQLEYTAFWCIRMLLVREKIDTVIPEGVEDVIVVQRGWYALHQVKTRDESRGPWTVAEVLPILCQQYHRRGAFPGPCRFHFVSNQIADSKTALSEKSYGALYRLKSLLELLHDGQTLSAEEDNELKRYQRRLIPRIRAILKDKHQDPVDEPTALALLHNTWIHTDCKRVHYPIGAHELDPSNIAELENALMQVLPGAPPCTNHHLRQVYSQLLEEVLARVLTGNTIEERKVFPQDVLDCRAVTARAGTSYADLDGAPGKSLLDKKAWLGGFDPTELPLFHRQMKSAEWAGRELETLGMSDDLEHLATALLDLQGNCRHRVCRDDGQVNKPGPRILATLRPELASLREAYLPNSGLVDDQVCLGILWTETNACSIYWHMLDQTAERS